MKTAVAFAWVIFAVCCVLPVLWMLMGSAGTGTFAGIASGLIGERPRALMANALALGIGVTGVALIAGCAAGIVLARCHPRRVGLARFLLVVPLVLPSYVPALAWIIMFGAGNSAWVYSLPAAILVLGLELFPIIMLTTEAAVRSVPIHLEEAARLVARPARIWAGVLLPLIAPSLLASLLIVFVLAISDFAVPGLLRVRVYTTEVFTAFAAFYDFRLATLVALPIAAVAAVASAAALVFARRPSVARVDRGQTGATWSSRAQSTAVPAITIVAVAIVATLIGAVALEASAAESPLLTPGSIEAVRNTFVWAAAGASKVVIFATLLGYWRARTAASLGRTAEALWLTLFAIPATVVGIGLIEVWNRPGMAGDVYRSDAIVVIAYVARFLPIGALLCATFLQRVPVGVEDAAVVAGAGPIRTFARVVLPLSRRGLAAVWLVVFILMCGDVALTILVAPPGESNLGVWAYTLIANSPTSEVSRLALIQIAGTIVPLAAIAVLLRGGPQRA